VRRIYGIDCDDMFVDVILVHMVEMPIVKIVHMAVMANRGVPAVRAMLMGVVGMVLLGAGGHDLSFFHLQSDRVHRSHFFCSAFHRRPHHSID
jgi:hypothetical protein